MAKKPKRGTHAYEIKWLIFNYFAGTSNDEKFKEELQNILKKHTHQPFSLEMNTASSICKWLMDRRSTKKDEQKICDLVMDVVPQIGSILQNWIENIPHPRKDDDKTDIK